MFGFETDSNYIRWYHNIMMIICVITLIGGISIAWNASIETEYDRWSVGVEKTMDWGELSIYLPVVLVGVATEFIGVKVICEFFDNIYILAMNSKAKAVKAMASTNANISLRGVQVSNSKASLLGGEDRQNNRKVCSKCGEVQSATNTHCAVCGNRIY